MTVSLLAYPFIKRGRYESREREKMPATFFTQLPLIIDDMSYFKIPCTINGDSLVLIVDTKAQSLLKEEDIEKYGGEYFGKLPISMENAYKGKEEIRMYQFKDLKIQDQPFGNPIFQQISKNNLIYDHIGEGVLGTNILSLCHWKFSMDEQVVYLYSRKDTTAISSETSGYTQIPYGLRDNMIQLEFPCSHQSQTFTLDLGFDGEIEINNELADSLMRPQPFKTNETLRSDGSTGIIHLFENQKVVWNNIILNGCQLANIPDVDGNYIGAELMKRFNFILGYGDYIDHKKQDHLYIQPIHGFETLQSKPFMSEFGFNIKDKEGKQIISAIEVGGIAQKQDLRLGDVIDRIDHETLNANLFSSYTADKDSLCVQTRSKTFLLKRD